jgi:hypothetical protein
VIGWLLEWVLRMRVYPYALLWPVNQDRDAASAHPLLDTLDQDAKESRIVARVATVEARSCVRVSVVHGVPF